MPQNKENKNSASRGSVLIYILLGVALFSALMFAFSRSARQGGDNMGKKATEIAATDLIGYAQRLERGTNKIMLRGNMSESYLSFEHLSNPGYANAGCNALGNPATCKVFEIAGGGVEWLAPPDNINDGSPWIFTGYNQVPGIGVDGTADLVMILPGISEGKCITINNVLGVTNPGGTPPQDTDDINTTAYTGTFSNTARIGETADLDGISAACVTNTVPNPDTHFFYAVLLGR